MNSLAEVRQVAPRPSQPIRGRSVSRPANQRRRPSWPLTSGFLVLRVASHGTGACLTCQVPGSALKKEFDFCLHRPRRETGRWDRGSIEEICYIKNLRFADMALKSIRWLGRSCINGCFWSPAAEQCSHSKAGYVDNVEIRRAWIKKTIHKYPRSNVTWREIDME